MDRNKPAIHLVAQREALIALESEDGNYVEVVNGWIAMLHPVERNALKAYDRMVEAYKSAAPQPPTVPDTFH